MQVRLVTSPHNAPTSFKVDACKVQRDPTIQTTFFRKSVGLVQSVGIVQMFKVSISKCLNCFQNVLSGYGTTNMKHWESLDYEIR